MGALGVLLAMVDRVSFLGMLRRVVSTIESPDFETENSSVSTEKSMFEEEKSLLVVWLVLSMAAALPASDHCLSLKKGGRGNTVRAYVQFHQTLSYSLFFFTTKQTTDQHRT